MPDLRRLPAQCFLRELFNNGFLSQVKKYSPDVREYSRAPGFLIQGCSQYSVNASPVPGWVVACSAESENAVRAPDTL